MKTTVLLIFFFSFNTWSFDLTHKDYQVVLDKVLSFKGAQTLVDYKGLKKDPSVLNEYLEAVAKVTQNEFNGWNKADQLAFLINAYNAFTLQLIINHYPVKSIKKIGGFFSSPWKMKFFTLFGKKTNLDKIEHGLIRANYKEPRIHFAVNCASISCPNLQPFVFTGSNLEKQLQQSAKSFLGDKSKNYFAGKTLHASIIFKWYGADFKEGFKAFVADFVTSDKASQKLIRSGKVKTQFLEYDWNLNEK